MSRITKANRAGDEEEDRARHNGGSRDELSNGAPSEVKHGDDQGAAQDSAAPSDEAQQQGDQGAEQKNAEAPAKPPLYKRPVFWIVLAVIVIVGGITALLWWLHARYRVSTDDAFIQAHYTTVSPRVSGHVIRVLVDDNQEVKKGDRLVLLDDKDFIQAVKSAQASEKIAEAQLNQANANLASAKASVAQAQADVSAAAASAKQAEADKQRYRSLQKADPRAVSQQQVDQAEANARTTAAQLEAARQKQGAAEAQVGVALAQIVSAKASVEKAQSDLDNANLQLSYTRIDAAEDGQVTNRSVEIGNYVTPGQALMAIVPRNVWVTANYKETQLKKMQVGQPVTIHVDAFGIDLPGHVQSIQAGSGAAFSLLPPENATGNYVKVVQRVPVKITFDQLPAQRLTPGMSVEPTVDVRPR
jgi:membrane fusion protein (multidrug efflux system)